MASDIMTSSSCSSRLNEEAVLSGSFAGFDMLATTGSSHQPFSLASSTISTVDAMHLLAMWVHTANFHTLFVIPKTPTLHTVDAMHLLAM